MKKVLLGLGGLMAVVLVLPMFAAFEAHVVNVTATIENALSVPTSPIKFGTVFPQEVLVKYLPVTLSASFRAEQDADDVEYMIRQKPKCAWTWTDEGVWQMSDNTQTGHVVPVLDDPETEVDESKGGTAYTIDCGEPTPRPVFVEGQEPLDLSWGVLPSLCEYISKHEVTLDSDPKYQGGENDGGLDSFHQPWWVSGSKVFWNEVRGRLAKSAQDFEDRWAIDLAVPCFGGHCAQDWEEFVWGINESVEDPSEYTQPIANEHKIFGCDLWVEVTGVSRFSDENGGTPL